MESVGKFIGYLNCDTCGYQYITDANTVIIWYAMDAVEQMVEAICTSCRKKLEADIDEENFIAFRTHGVKVRSLSDKFSILTDKEIEDWDINKELQIYLQ